MARLTTAQLQRLQNIPLGPGANGRTKFIDGDAREEACRNFALTGGTPAGGDELTKVLGLINLGGTDNPMIAAVRQEYAHLGARGQEREVRRVTAPLARDYRAGIAGFWDRRWANRQKRKHAGGGKYTPTYMVEKVVKRAVQKQGLSVVTGPTDYYICTHWPTDVGVGEEHWWLEVHGYTVEIMPDWHDLLIYSHRDPDPAHYSQVRVGLNGLLPRHIERIDHVLLNGQLTPTLHPDEDGNMVYGWS
jgi:hypothetical protein